MAPVCLDICTTIPTLQRTCFKQPRGRGFVTCHTPQQMHTISEMAHISSFIINLGDHHTNDSQAVGFTCCSSFVVYNAATHSMLTRCDDALLYHFDVPLQMLVIMDYIFL